MKLISKNQLATHCMATLDENRQSHRYIHFKDNIATTTNGHVLLQVKNTKPLSEKDFPVTSDYGEVPEKSFIPKELAEKAMKNFPKNGIPILDNNQALHFKKGKVYLSTHGIDISERCQDIKFPNFEQIIPSKESLDNGVRVAVSAVYMKQICEFIIRAQGKDPCHRIELHFQKERPENNAMKITAITNDGEEIMAVIMPIRL